MEKKKIDKNRKFSEKKVQKPKTLKKTEFTK